MSTDPKYILEVIPPGRGMALDLGGKNGQMRQPLEMLGYEYVNLDIRSLMGGEPSVVGSAHQIPFQNETFDLVIAKDSLEHFEHPKEVTKEVRRILKPGATFVVWVPFMHPAHGDDLYRYSPLALRGLLKDFEIQRFDSPLGALTVIGVMIGEFMNQLGLKWTTVGIRNFFICIDYQLLKTQKKLSSFAAAYRLLVKKPAIS